MNILILAAGHREFDTGDGNYPLCLTEFDGVPMLERIANACASLNPKHMVFAMRKDEVNRFHLDHVVSLLSSKSVALKVESSTKGAACTALLASSYIDSDDELLVINANELVDIDLSELVADFRARDLDAGVVTFRSVHPRYSYVRLSPDGLVTEATEKKPISSNATAGLYWYAHGRDLLAAIKNMIRKDAHVDGVFYICPSFNEMVLLQKRIGTVAIDAKRYHPLKTERQLHTFESLHEHGVQA
jgi:NDP-sugar pyrophosphorylase family protein